MSWWREPVRNDASPVPRWALGVLGLLTLGLEGLLWWLLPSLGVHWFYDFWRVGGFLGLVVPLLLAAWFVDRQWPSDDDE